MKYLGVDFGLKKIGLAISEGSFATPFEVLHIKNKKDALQKILQVVEKEEINEIIMGLPDSGIRFKILKFANKLRLIASVKIVEETLTSHNAKRQMIETGLGKKKRTEEDAYSAALILQDYLDNL
ncbi:hypothetical protein A3B42_02080 [Candidatus Daviesbacteria bacterium RIFCSPLOWO2_01_FULL_38_10]|uniref:Putative pre-16S rRNA nuclease n=1 Tax=Candidatus Daviesbacteria bacterium GW2011_GWF2_38_6 TaxID=1618432 RepID=A0A0G0KK10_9BACT|nr:MAG: hypothetical protein US80_C0006G0019 [Candidatus Daviesbacteria bacterium GW2011_GWA2_38_17]KKQ79087.1 MAG: hypothetical protein US99_C0003G0008 [Candidatus Daviesbacteria bacterium GW2011_GWF2_38_6]OGE25871.1 MAG: hypothetical protein A3D02_01400 [Candidatus Daviesbacteria bacterium RIFCSPHIGHO2_02_FULL_39_41]OGE29712.1 MAG: hypothetical protein A2772_03010 [Candidatus Daviesbacteria bacterium RIFCSPHIGHO2_01_FULL_38_8b]OGE39124.1 MAG: hypothetical protein A3B42_02080 [Candidatus Davie